MDGSAFGSIYPQQSQLPYASGLDLGGGSSNSFPCCRAVWVGGAGNVQCTFADSPGTAITFTGVPAGTLLKIAVTNVATASTATNMTALF